MSRTHYVPGDGALPALLGDQRRVSAMEKKHVRCSNETEQMVYCVCPEYARSQRCRAGPHSTRILQSNNASACSFVQGASSFLRGSSSRNLKEWNKRLLHLVSCFTLTANRASSPAKPLWLPWSTRWLSHSRKRTLMTF